MDRIKSPPGRHTAAAWSEARLERLVSLWNGRLSTNQIARALGPGVTRSAVVGKLLRLGLRRSGEERQEAQAAGARWSQARLQRRGGAGPPLLPTSPLPDPTPCAVVPRLEGILELRGSSCRWPYDLAGETRFCAHRVKPDSSYCAEHHAIAYFAVLPPLTLEALEGRVDRKRLDPPTR